MCYSQTVVQSYKTYVQEHGVKISIRDFVELFVKRKQGAKALIPKGLEDPFLHSTSDELSEIRELIEEHRAAEALRLEQELFAQRKRLADAERKLSVKQTKAASESKRIATDKIERAQSKHADLTRREPKLRDSRIFPGSYALVMVAEEGKRVIKPMRYLCRPAGKPASVDVELPGCYNARRGSLGGYWRNLWGHTHGLVIASAFYEHVNLHRAEGRELAPGEELQDVILEFIPRPAVEMLVACLWSRWTAPGEPDLLSFAAITDEPPPEVAAAGHDRCLVPLAPENIDAWLNPNPRDLKTQERILDERFRPYYEHRMAA